MSLHCEIKCSRCKKKRKASNYGISQRGTPHKICKRCRRNSSAKKQEKMQEPTIKLTWEEFLVRGKYE